MELTAGLDHNVSITAVDGEVGHADEVRDGGVADQEVHLKMK